MNRGNSWEKRQTEGIEEKEGKVRGEGKKRKIMRKRGRE